MVYKRNSSPGISPTGTLRSRFLSATRTTSHAFQFRWRQWEYVERRLSQCGRLVSTDRFMGQDEWYWMTIPWNPATVGTQPNQAAITSFTSTAKDSIAACPLRFRFRRSLPFRSTRLGPKGAGLRLGRWVRVRVHHRPPNPVPVRLRGGCLPRDRRYRRDRRHDNGPVAGAAKTSAAGPSARTRTPGRTTTCRWRARR